MKRINKSSVLSLFCAFVMLLSLCLIPGVKSEAAAKAPAIDKSIVMFRNSYNRTIRIKNMKRVTLSQRQFQRAMITVLSVLTLPMNIITKFW